MTAKRVLLLLVLSVLSTLILAGLGLLRREAIHMMDFWAVRYGFPYWWVEHVIVTFAGPTNYWHFETSNLVRNMIIYFALSLVVWSAIFLMQRKTKSKSIFDSARFC